MSCLMPMLGAGGGGFPKVIATGGMGNMPKNSFYSMYQNNNQTCLLMIYADLSTLTPDNSLLFCSSTTTDNEAFRLNFTNDGRVYIEPVLMSYAGIAGITLLSVETGQDMVAKAIVTTLLSKGTTCYVYPTGNGISEGFIKYAALAYE